MNNYRSTINIAGCPRGKTAMFPDTPRTASLVADGVLVPVVRAITEPEDGHRYFDGAISWDERSGWSMPFDGTVGEVAGDGSGEGLPVFDYEGEMAEAVAKSRLSAGIVFVHPDDEDPQL